MGINFIGPDELKIIGSQFGIKNPLTTTTIPGIPYDERELKRLRNTSILILGVHKFDNNDSMTLKNLRARFGFDPANHEPCFYNQDWYINESFFTKQTIDLKWYIVGKDLESDSRGKPFPTGFVSNEGQLLPIPTAILCAYTFFVYYFHSKGEILWPHDYLWCQDTDHNGDQIYIGRYIDPDGINKNGFNIHRFLRINNRYGRIKVV